MRFVTSSIAAALLASQVLGHPSSTHSSRRSTGALQPRVIDLSAFRLKALASYTNATSTTESDIASLVKRADYLDTATSLVQQIAPGAEFRLVDDHYVGDNGVGHVNFKQTVNGLDIDNADFNVNVS
jgi:extracellular elastinolytic metalloproteinase